MPRKKKVVAKKKAEPKAPPFRIKAGVVAELAFLSLDEKDSISEILGPQAAAVNKIIDQLQWYKANK